VGQVVEIDEFAVVIIIVKTIVPLVVERSASRVGVEVFQGDFRISTHNVEGITNSQCVLDLSESFSHDFEFLDSISLGDSLFSSVGDSKSSIVNVLDFNNSSSSLSRSMVGSSSSVLSGSTLGIGFLRTGAADRAGGDTSFLLHSGLLEALLEVVVGLVQLGILAGEVRVVSLELLEGGDQFSQLRISLDLFIQIIEITLRDSLLVGLGTSRLVDLKSISSELNKRGGWGSFGRSSGGGGGLGLFFNDFFRFRNFSVIAFSVLFFIDNNGLTFFTDWGWLLRTERI